MKGFANAQDRDIGKQCLGGSRFFDIRIKDGRADHGGYRSATLDKILTDVAGFLGSDNGQSEFIILRFSKSNKQYEITEAVKKIDRKLLLLGDRNIATTKLGETRGKLIACFAADEIVKKGVFGKKSVKEQFGLLIDPDEGIHSFKKMKGSVADGATGLYTCGVYFNSPSIADRRFKPPARAKTIRVTGQVSNSSSSQPFAGVRPCSLPTCSATDRT